MNSKILQGSMVVVLILIFNQGWDAVKAKGKEWLPVKYVRIEGAFQYISKDEIKQVLIGSVDNGIYNLDLWEIKKVVLELPWIAEVNVKRVWPDTLKIGITEQTPLVRWKDYALLNTNAEIFEPENIGQFQNLPLLAGPEGQEKKLLEVLKGLIVELNDQHMTLVEFRVNERRSWQIKLKEGMELKLGRNEPFKKFQRFLNTFTLLGHTQNNEVKIVDLRYPNGYAITWKQDKEKINWNEIAETNLNKVY